MSYYNSRPGYPLTTPYGAHIQPHGITAYSPMSTPYAAYMQQQASRYGMAQSHGQELSQYAALIQAQYAAQVAQAGYMPHYYQPPYSQQPYLQQQLQYGTTTPSYPLQSVHPHLNQLISPNLQMDSCGLPQVLGDVTLQFAQTFRLEERNMSATRDSFIVRDSAGTLKYKVDGSFTVNELKTLKDVNGMVLLKLREARLTMRHIISLYDATGVAVMTLQKASSFLVGSKRVHGYLGSHPSGIPAIVITINHNNTLFKITNSQHQEIATIRRKKFSLRNMISDQDTYDITVIVGSPALICLITVALDEMLED